jgi:xanthosine utilization system XapX-like protein
MNRKFFTTLTALMWLALPLTALRYWQVWDHLPARMATHFGAHGQPNGWMPRETSLSFALSLTAFLLVIFTGIAFVILKQKAAPDPSSIALLGFFCVIVGFVYYGNHSVIEHNLTGSPVTVAPLLLGLLVAIVLFSLIYLRAQRGPALPVGQTIAEEVHGSRVFAGLFVVLALVPFAVFASVPTQAGVRVGMGLLGLLFLVIAAHAWDGFHYRFTPAGLEVSTLGFRLRSIPTSQIGKYRIEKWMALRGYGIRGVGNTRAYVWGNNVVHLTTLEGEVFLGHNDPARIVRDLDVMKQFAHS